MSLSVSWTGKVSYSVPYFIGDEPSSSNYRPGYCNKCDADSPDECRCTNNSSSRDFTAADSSIHHQQDYVCDKCGRCEECDQDHSYHPDFSGVQISIDIVSERLGTKPKDHGILSSVGADLDSTSVLKTDRVRGLYYYTYPAKRKSVSGH
jgi:hypothetical protein